MEADSLPKENLNLNFINQICGNLHATKSSTSIEELTNANYLAQNQDFHANFQALVNIHQKSHSSTLDQHFTENKIDKSIKNLEEEIEKWRFPHLQTNSEKMETQREFPENFFNAPASNYKNSLTSFDSMKEINIMEKLKLMKEEEKSPTLMHSTHQYIKFKIINLDNLKTKDKFSNIYNAIVDLNNFEIVILNQFAHKNSPRSEFSKSSRAGPLFNLNPSFGSFHTSSNESGNSISIGGGVGVNSNKFGYPLRHNREREGSHFREQSNRNSYY